MLQALNSHFLLLDAQARLITLLKKRSHFHQNQIRESDARKGENLQELDIMNLVSLVAFENFELMIQALSFATIVTLQSNTEVYNILSN